MIAYTGSAEYQCVLLLCFFCGFGMFASYLPVCDMSFVEHANANKQGMTAPLQAESGESPKCVVPLRTTGSAPLSWHPWSNSALAGMVGKLFDRVDRGGDDRTLLY